MGAVASAKTNAKTCAKIAALKKTLKPRNSKLKKATSIKGRQKQAKSLTKALSISTTKPAIASVSTKHNAGRRVLCESLDQSASVASEALRGIGCAKEIPTPEQLAERAKIERERMAQAYEHDQMVMQHNVEELANLMSSSS
ncbi:hypothetical protein IWW36_000591 [Coemansia brasiliensis]|uniref:Uncharacterized protein n=1 Tax=Coemansia brasiliensis TaxID=2650707 RepID=A0A9W8IAX0_9FUNG|nr:hypothetical protein IWW36_000591 [Coemansia brasiliensis]